MQGPTKIEKLICNHCEFFEFVDNSYEDWIGVCGNVCTHPSFHEPAKNMHGLPIPAISYRFISEQKEPSTPSFCPFLSKE